MLLCFTTSADSRRDRRHMTEHQARLARLAYTDFGKGSGHPAGLNFGDCLSYALATDLREPLLWKGNDFGHTGIQSALRG
jgi:ribonuclease VapC